MSSFWKTCARCVSTVFTLTKSSCATTYDYLDGGRGNYIVRGGKDGGNTLIGSLGDDQLFAYSADVFFPDVVSGGKGIDTATVNKNKDQVTGVEHLTSQ